VPQLIQRAPHGLLALLGSKAGGANPNTLSDEVSPGIELRDLYEVRQRRSTNVTAITGAALAAGVGTFIAGAATLAQPQSDAIWHVRNISLRATGAILAGGDILQVAIGWQDVRNTSLAIAGNSPRFTAGMSPCFGVNCDLFIGPGQILGVYVIEATTPDDIVLQTTFDLYQPV